MSPDLFRFLDVTTERSVCKGMLVGVWVEWVETVHVRQCGCGGRGLVKVVGEAHVCISCHGKTK